MMMGEAVVAFDEELAANIKYYRKQSAQLASKMRYLSAQFVPYLESGLWLRNAEHANRQAQRLAMRLAALPHVELTQPVDTNQIFLSVLRRRSHGWPSTISSTCGTRRRTKCGSLRRGIPPTRISTGLVGTLETILRAL